MRLLSLELQGFKSFPEKTTLAFGDGITAVVGPNGSGKSNIADAIRWVLGEQSTKTLRGNRMEDVIFGGTQTRNAVGYALVQITIDNSSGDLVEYDEEISIARRIYRSGESEYRINGNQVRLKDVHELFMDTGLGRDGYSIIGQGRIAEIVSAKSNDRREIFEEAAGIAKFRYRRTDAERRLAGADENLVRLLDILTELEDRVEPLRIQSEKANKFLLLAEERKGLEISLWTLDLDRLKEQIGEQTNKVLIAKNDYNRLEQESKTVEDEIVETYKRMQELSIAADERRVLIRSMEESRAAKESSVAVLKNDIHHNNQAAQRIGSDLESFDSSDSNMKEQQKEKQAKLDEAKAELNKTTDELRSFQAEYQTFVQAMERAKLEISDLQSRKLALELSVSSQRLEQASTSTLVSENRSRIIDLEKSTLLHKSAVEENRNNLDECSLQLDEQEKKLKLLLESKQVLVFEEEQTKKALKSKQSEHMGLSQDIQLLRSRLKLLQELESNMEGFAGSVKHIVKQQENGKINGVCGIVSNLISTKSEYTTAIETALGGAAQNIVVEDESVAKQCMNILKQAKAGRATFLPLTSVKGTESDYSKLKSNSGFIGVASNLVEVSPQYKGIINQILGRVCIVDNLDTGIVIARDNSYRFRIVTLDGQVINAGGSYTGGSTARGAGAISRKNEIDNLVLKGKSLREKADEIQPVIDDIAAKGENISDKISKISYEIKLGEEEKVRLGYLFQQLTKACEQALEGQKNALSELDNLKNRLDEIQVGENSSTKVIEQSALEIESLEVRLVGIHQSQLDSEEKVKFHQQVLTDMQMKEHSLVRDIESLEQDFQRLTEQIKLSDSSKERLLTEKEELISSNSDILEQIDLAKKDIENYISEAACNNQSIQEFMEKRSVLEKQTTDLRQKEREQSSQREAVSRELVRLEERSGVVQSQYDSIIAKLWDEYQLTRSQAIEVAVIPRDSESSKRRLNELKNQIRSLGSINVEAIDEYVEVNERYQFLSEQINDIENSKQKLAQLIGELTKEMQALFANTFTQINKEFEITFRELFGGGKGELTLTDEEDLLESGIEIHVQPPGKAIKNLSLLSGGEQAFIAIAIYFAILKVKPAPFVLLDEIEAALDDVNVSRFAAYLRTMSYNTQFIAITHRRGTMEEADVLYGVTMQEEGVSKLLELDVSEANSKLGMERDG